MYNIFIKEISIKTQTFNHKGHYVCECGKEFTTSQSFNGHKSRCLEHYISIGKENEYYSSIKNRNKASAEGIKLHSQKLKTQNLNNYKSELEKWLAEEHRCETCGKIMTEKFGSGRFCSRTCANTRKHSKETKHKISLSLLKSYNPELSDDELLCLQEQHSTAQSKRAHRIKYSGPKLPSIDKNLDKGYNTRNKLPYSEQFWKKVLDNNNVKYEMNVQVWKPGHNDYWLDFLIGNVDLEIDGAFHNLEECVEKDNKRTKWLESLGYKVYRIKWVNPNSEKNKIIVNKQIQDLFDYLNIERLN